MFLLVYINDLTADFKSNVKRFADDTPLFTIVPDPNTAANDMNHDLGMISKWAHDWRMFSFNPDPQQQAVELIFSKRKAEANHLVILFNNLPVMQVFEHKHLGLVLDSKLSFSTHINSAMSNTRRGVGMLGFLSICLGTPSMTCIGSMVDPI